MHLDSDSLNLMYFQGDTFQSYKDSNIKIKLLSQVFLPLCPCTTRLDALSPPHSPTPYLARGRSFTSEASPSLSLYKRTRPPAQMPLPPWSFPSSPYPGSSILSLPPPKPQYFIRLLPFNLHESSCNFYIPCMVLNFRTVSVIKYSSQLYPAGAPQTR